MLIHECYQKLLGKQYLDRGKLVRQKVHSDVQGVQHD